MKSNKKAYTLFELILVLFTSSIILIYTFSFQKELYETQNTNEKMAILKIDLNSSKIIIEKNLPQIIDKLSYKNNTLYYEDFIFLENVSFYETSKETNSFTIDITLEDKISQKWKFKL